MGIVAGNTDAHRHMAQNFPSPPIMPRLPVGMVDEWITQKALIPGRFNCLRRRTYRLPVVLGSTTSPQLWFLLYHIVHGHCLPFPSIIPSLKYYPCRVAAEPFLRLVQTPSRCDGSRSSTTHVGQFMDATFFKSIHSDTSYHRQN